MKFTYKLKYTKILNANPYGQAIDTLAAAGFESKSGQKPQLTDAELIFRNKDWTQANNEYLAGFFGGKEAVMTGYVGRWTDDLEANAKLYYIVDGNNVREFIVTQYNEMKFTNDLDGYAYYVNMDGNLMSALVEEGDTIYDSYEEAIETINIKK